MPQRFSGPRFAFRNRTPSEDKAQPAPWVVKIEIIVMVVGLGLTIPLLFAAVCGLALLVALANLVAWFLLGWRAMRPLIRRTPHALRPGR